MDHGLEVNLVSVGRYSEAGLRAHSLLLSAPPSKRVRFQATLHVAIIDTNADAAAERSAQQHARPERRRSGSKAMTADISAELHRHAETQKHLISCVEAKAEARWGAIPEEEDMVPCPNCGVHVHPIHLRRRQADIICGTCFLVRNADVAVSSTKKLATSLPRPFGSDCDAHRLTNGMVNATALTICSRELLNNFHSTNQDREAKQDRKRGGGGTKQSSGESGGPP